MISGNRVGRWTLLSRLGEGGFGSVWRAQHADGRVGSLKIFQREVTRRIDLAPLETIAKVRAPGIPEVLDYGTAEDGSVFVVSRYVEGKTLEGVLSAGVLAPAQVRVLGIALCRGLQALHERGLVHRDVKPANVIIPSHHSTLTEGLADAQLIDLALVGEVERSAGLTQALVFVGTPRYMSPEQVRGLGLTPKSDVFSLGVVLFEAATGTLAFPGDSLPEVLIRIVTGRPQLDLLPAELRPDIEIALRTDPKERLDSTQLAESLARGPLLFPQASFGAPIPAASSPACLSGRADGTAAEPAGRVDARVAPKPAPGDAHLPIEAMPSRRRFLWWVIGSAVAVLSFSALLAAMGTASAGSSGPVLVALAVAAAVTTGLLVFALLLRRLNATDATAKRAANLKAKRDLTTRSVALMIDEVAQACKAHPQAALFTQSMAFALEEYDASAALSPKDRTELSMKIIDIAMEIGKRVEASGGPWYVRHKELVSVVSALGTAIVVWFGLTRDVRGALMSTDANGIVLGCPREPVSLAVGLVLRATDEVGTLSWSMGGKPLVVSPAFRFPDDTGALTRPGALVIYAETLTTPKRRERCVVDLQ